MTIADSDFDSPIHHRHEYDHHCEHCDEIIVRLGRISDRLNTLEILAGMNIVAEIETQEEIEDLHGEVEDLADELAEEGSDDPPSESDDEDDANESDVEEVDTGSEEHHEEEHHETHHEPARTGVPFGR